jgi:hypothetical protein
VFTACIDLTNNVSTLQLQGGVGSAKHQQQRGLCYSKAGSFRNSDDFRASSHDGCCR